MFQYNQRLGISIPVLQGEWTDYTLEEQEMIMAEWECIRGTIPDRIQTLEAAINKKQEEMNNEEQFSVSCRLNTEISELASIINDLWLWFRTVPEVKTLTAPKKLHL